MEIKLMEKGSQERFSTWLDRCPLQVARMAANNGRGITWYDLARRAGLTQSILIRWADGAVTNPLPENITAVATVLGDPNLPSKFYQWLDERPIEPLE